MENNNYDYREEIIEYPENYEEIANLALLNFEKNCKLDLNNLIKKGLNSEEIINNEINDKKDENNADKKKDDWEDFDSDDDNDNKEDGEEQINKFNNYQAFEDEEENKDEKDDVDKCDNIHEKNKENENENKYIYSEIENHHIDDKIVIENKTDNNENMIKLKIKEKNKNQTHKINDKKIKEKMSKIKYATPNWAINMKDEDFIKTVKNFLTKNKI